MDDERKAKLLQTFMRNVEDAMRQRGKRSWTELSEATGVYASKFSKWRGGKGDPPLSYLVAISEALEVGIDRLISEDMGRLPEQPDADTRLAMQIIKDIGAREAVRRIARGAVPAGDMPPKEMPPARPVLHADVKNRPKGRRGDSTGKGKGGGKAG